MSNLKVLLLLVTVIIFVQFYSPIKFACVLAVHAWPQENLVVSNLSHVKASLIANTKEIVANQPFKLSVKLKMDPGWHTYYKNSGDAGMPTRIEWLLPPGFQVGPLEWLQPEKFNESGIITYGYKDQTLISAQVTPPPNLKAGETLTLGAKVRWLGCKDVCVPGEANLTIKLKAAAVGLLLENKEKLYHFTPEALSGKAVNEDLTKNILDEKLKIKGVTKHTTAILPYLVFAFVGGFILNFMPCVLPVISIKILSLVGQASDEPRRVFQLGLVFSLGVVLSFLSLAAIVIVLQQAGEAVGWGFQFQHPAFLIFMSVLILLFALSLFGFFYISPPAGQATIDKLASREGYWGTFFKGVLATILATPCTAPFLGTAMGFAFTQPGWVVVTIFLFVSLGMSFPYLLLTAKPGWMRYIPRPGAWMETLKQMMGFLLLGTVIWLLWILGKQVGLNGLVSTLILLLFVAIATWLVGRFTNLTSSVSCKVTVWTLALGLVFGACYICFLWPFGLGSNLQADTASISTSSNNGHSGNQLGPLKWQKFSIELLNRELSAGKTVFLDFTADWCLTCKVNEQTVLNTPQVVAKMRALNVVAMKADWTKQDLEITKLIAKFGRSGVPLYVIFPANRATEPIVLPEVITKSLVLSKLDEAGPSH